MNFNDISFRQYTVTMAAASAATAIALECALYLLDPKGTYDFPRDATEDWLGFFIGSLLPKLIYRK